MCFIMHGNAVAQHTYYSAAIHTSNEADLFVSMMVFTRWIHWHARMMDDLFMNQKRAGTWKH